MHMVMFVLDDPNKLDDVLEAWNNIGVSGVTIAETTSFFRRNTQHVGARYLFGISRVSDQAEAGHFALFTVVPSIDVVDQCIAAAETIVGDLSEPNTGILTAWPLAKVKGVPSRLLNPEEDRQ
ncbi:MAG: hypothetical protein GYB66_16615 [Chloroflexi bacterium]|nr:hypothetical protein [Chloroflexota bacterium]